MKCLGSKNDPKLWRYQCNQEITGISVSKKKKKKESITTQYFYSNLLCKNTERALLDMFTSFAEFIRNETYLMFRKAIW